MTDSTQGGYTPPTTPLYDQEASQSVVDTTTSPTGDTGNTADRAKDEAKSVASDAQDAGQHVAATAKDQAGAVVGEAKGQARDLYHQTTSELKDQAGAQQQRAAGGLRSISDELASMADRSDGGGVATELVRNLSGRAGSVASWLEGRDPGSLLDDVKSYAARKPGTFIAIAAGIGIVGGRLTKALAADAKSGTPRTSSPSAPASDSERPDTTPSEPPFRTQAAYAERSDTIGGGGDGYPAEPTFDDLLQQSPVPGLRTDADDRS